MGQGQHTIVSVIQQVLVLLLVLLVSAAAAAQQQQQQQATTTPRVVEFNTKQRDVKIAKGAIVTTRGEFAHQVAIIDKNDGGSQFCGGSTSSVHYNNTIDITNAFLLCICNTMIGVCNYPSLSILPVN